MYCSELVTRAASYTKYIWQNNSNTPIYFNLLTAIKTMTDSRLGKYSVLQYNSKNCFV